MRELTPRERDLKSALFATAKSAASTLLPPLGQAIEGYDQYKRSAFERTVNQLLLHLSAKVDDIAEFFQQEYFTSDEGRVFAQKLVDAALDIQQEEKQELFVNALVNGPVSSDLPALQKLKYIDMLRALSLASLTVLAEIHTLFQGQVRGPGRKTPENGPFPLVSQSNIVSRLSVLFDPFLIAAALTELHSQGLFNSTGDWRKNPSGGYSSAGGFATELAYTHFDALFVEFVSRPRQDDKTVASAPAAKGMFGGILRPSDGG